MFEIQRRLAEGVTAALAVNLTPLDRARLARAATSDLEALDAYSRGQSLLERPDVAGNVPRAIQSFRAAVARDPAFALAHAGLGQAYWRQYLEARDPASAQAATAAVTEALRLDPDEPGTRLALATVYAGTGRGDAAIEELRKIIARLPSNDDAHRQLGDILAARSRWEEAIAELRTAVELRPKFAENVGHLGVALLASGRYPEAVDAFQRATALQPDNSRVFQRLGTAYHAMGDEEQALENYRRALVLAPDSKAYGNIGVLEYGRGRFAEAAAAFAEAARLDPKSPVAQRNLGDAYTRLGRRGDAAQAYGTAVRLCEARAGLARRLRGEAGAPGRRRPARRGRAGAEPGRRRRHLSQGGGERAGRTAGGRAGRPARSAGTRVQRDAGAHRRRFRRTAKPSGFRGGAGGRALREESVHQSRWITGALLVVLTVTLSCAPQGQGTGGGAGGGRYKPPKKDRYANVVIVNINGVCKVAGPKNHIAQPDENITWRVFDTCAVAKQALVVELTFQPAASGCPSPPLRESPPYATEAMNVNDVKDLKLKVKNQGFPADTECAYPYSVKIQGDNTSEIDPELDIWP